MLTRLPNLKMLILQYVDNEYWKVLEYVFDATSAASKQPETGVTMPFLRLDEVGMGGVSISSTLFC